MMDRFLLLFSSALFTFGYFSPHFQKNPPPVALNSPLQDSLLVKKEDAAKSDSLFQLFLKGGGGAPSPNSNVARGDSTTSAKADPNHAAVTLTAKTDTAVAKKDWVPGQVDTTILKEIAAGMVRVAGGTFTMGCKEGYCDVWVLPAHTVTLTDFKIGKFLITQKQWQAIMDTNPSAFKGCPDCPVEKVSWNDIQQFIARLNQLTGKKYRLPTEAEWEFAAKGGIKSRGYKFTGATYSIGWIQENSNGRTHPVGQKSLNELGLFDMMGNVWEWCADRYGPYKAGSVKNPLGPETGNNRVIRGCGWKVTVQTCSLIMRSPQAPDMRTNDVGFRLAE